jgi:HEPN domain-containing protein
LAHIIARRFCRGGNYSHALFFCHLCIEKMLKAVIVKKTNSAPPFVHDLVRLAEKAGIVLDDKNKTDLSEISTFNIAARYDDYKLQFAKKATKVFSAKYIKCTGGLLVWLQKHL